MNIEEIRKKTTDQLHVELENLYKESFNLRFQKSSGQLVLQPDFFFYQ